MGDSARLNRVHVANVRFDGNKKVYLVVLHDKDGKFDSEVTWDSWVNFIRDELRGN